MPDNYYNENPGGDMVPAGPDATPPAGSPGEKEEYGETALLPKSILGGKEFKPGEEVVLEIVHIYEDEVEVKYASEEGSKEEEAGETASMEKAEGELESMAE